MYNLSAYPPNGSSPLYPAAVPIQAPYPQQPPPQPPLWSSGLCGCAEDCSTCWLTFFCPCITFGRVAEIVDEGRTNCCVHASIYTLLCAVCGVQYLYSCFYRTKLRTKYNLSGSQCGDCCVHCWCERCALSQEYRELHKRGLNPSAGWVGPMPSAPPMASGMYR